jgi:hypothetical protein
MRQLYERRPMDNETFNAMVFMVFGLGFFMFVTRMLSRDHREAWQQRMMELREFGPKILKKVAKTPDPETLPDK